MRKKIELKIVNCASNIVSKVLSLNTDESNQIVAALINTPLNKVYQLLKQYLKDKCILFMLNT